MASEELSHRTPQTEYSGGNKFADANASTKIGALIFMTRERTSMLPAARVNCRDQMILHGGNSLSKY